MGLVETQAFMPIPNVLKSMQGFADLTYCGHLVIMECVVCSSGGAGGFGLDTVVEDAGDVAAG